MAGTEDYKNNPLYTDITRLDFSTPAPSFSYNWNPESGRWEPAGAVNIENLNIDSLEIDFSETNSILSGISGSLSSYNQEETLRLLSGISGSLSSINDTETHRLLSGISGSLASLDDQETHRLLSGVSGEISNLNFNQFKLITKTVNQKIEEDFILLENIPDSKRFGDEYNKVYGENTFVIDEIYNTYYSNGRTTPHDPETGHVEYFIHEESTNPDRSVDSIHVFHSDTNHALRFDNPNASLINSYELKDFSELYDQGLAESITLLNESTYPIQFHTIDIDYDTSKTSDPENNNLIILNPDTSVSINTDEASRIFIKRPYTLSGFLIKYNITYKEPIE